MAEHINRLSFSFAPKKNDSEKIAAKRRQIFLLENEKKLHLPVVCTAEVEFAVFALANISHV